jgi:hypothetical protein
VISRKGASPFKAEPESSMGARSIRYSIASKKGMKILFRNRMMAAVSHPLLGMPTIARSRRCFRIATKILKK